MIEKIGRQFDEIVWKSNYEDNYVASGSGLWAYDEQVERASHFLCENSINNKVLDIGSGIGRFCILAAKLHPNFQFEGIELDQKRVDLANSIAKAMEVKNVKFICGDFRDLDISEYGGFFIYSPFRMGAGHETNTNPYQSNWNDDFAWKYVNEMNQITAHKLSKTPTGTKYAKYDGSHSILTPEGFKSHENSWIRFIKQ